MGEVWALSTIRSKMLVIPIIGFGVFLFVCSAGEELRVLCTLGKHFTTELPPPAHQLRSFFYQY